MTIINNIELDNTYYRPNNIKCAIANNDPLEEKLNVIAVISNPCLFAKRYILMNEFIKRIEIEETNVNLFIVELCYGNQEFIITKANNPNHLQIRCEVPLWHKENMINLGVKRLLPVGWKSFAWIDADIEFENNSWTTDTLKILNGSCDVVQLFSHCADLDENDLTMNVFNSFGYQYAKGYKYCGKGPNFWHPGYAWAMTRKAYEKVGGLYELSILGSGDHMMAYSLIGNALNSINKLANDGYKQTIKEYQDKCRGLRLGYVPGVIRHYYHGTKLNRKYNERWNILINNNYDPTTYVTYDANGLIIPTDNFTDTFRKEILDYFKVRNEDEGLQVWLNNHTK